MLGFSFSLLTAWGSELVWTVVCGRRGCKGKEGKGKERKGKEGKGRERKGKEGKGRERKGKEGKGRERKGKEGKGREEERERKGGRKGGRKEGEVQIACGQLRREGARQHAGRRGNRGNSLGRASLGGSETACWTQRLWHREVFCAEKLLHTEALHKQNLNTEELLQTAAGGQRNFHKQKLLHTEDVLHRSFYTQKLLHRKPLHREVSTHRSFYIQKHLCKETFVQRSRVELNKMKFAVNASIMFIFQKDAGKRRKGNKPIITRICLLSFCFWVLRSPLVF